MQGTRNQVNLFTTRNLRRCAASALTLAGLCAATLAAAPAGAQTAASDSSTTSNAADWTSASSGWFYDSEHITYAIPPTGTWRLQYQHWFTPGAAPTAWTTFATPAKPTAAAWASTPAFDNSTTTTSPAGSTATSKWYINTYQSIFPAVPFFYAKYATKSLANCVSPDTSANSKTRIRDPYLYTNPGTDPNGLWNISTQFALWGSVQNTPGADNALTCSYGYAPNSTNEDLAQSLLDISIGGAATTVTANTDLIDQGRLLFLDSQGNPITLDEMVHEIDAFRTSSGWSLAPDLTAESFRPDYTQDLNQVLSFNMLVRMDQSDASAALFTDHGSAADAFAATPEPGCLALLAGLSVSGTVFTFKRRRK
jgi:hypothetical protein